jgi:hypothetical protein
MPFVSCMEKLDIKYINLESLTPYKNNSRTHSESQIKQIADSIDTFGWTNPIIIDEGNMVIAGHGRIEAAKLIGIKEVPCIELSKLTDAQKKAYVLADNKLAENSGWDNELLKMELDSLQEMNFDIGVIGFDAVELSTILGGFDNDESSDWSDNTPIIQYNIIFDNDEQQETWFNFIKNLKSKYPNLDTLGERLMEYVKTTYHG